MTQWATIKASSFRVRREVKRMTHHYELLKRILAIPDLSLSSASKNGDFLIVNSNKDNIHQMYKVNVSHPDQWINLTPVADRIVSCALSHDERQLVFPKENDGNEKHDLYVTMLDDLTPQLLLKLDSHRVLSVHWTPDDTAVIFDSSTDQAMGTWKCDVKTQELAPIYETQHLGFMGAGVNPKKPWISWMEQKPNNPRASVIKIINYKTGEIEFVLDVTESSNDLPMAWKGDGTKLLIQTDAPGIPTLAVWDSEDNSLTFLKATEMGLALDYLDAKWLPDSDQIVYSAKKNGNTRLLVEPESAGERPRELPLPKGTCASIRTVKEKPNLLYLTWSSLSHPPRILRYDVDTGQHEVIIDSMSNELKIKFSEGEFVMYQSTDGLTIPAFIVAPPSEYQLPNAPNVILVHGGPTWEIANDWNTMGSIIQLYATAGFRVFCPNFRGSTGYGSEFRDMNIGDLGGGDLNDILAAKKFLSSQFPESNHYFITGASYGGFMTFITMTKHPGVFTAGAAIVGITDWVAMHRLGDQLFKKFTERFFLGPPEENLELYNDRSAINFVANLSDPLLVIHRENDSRCPLQPVQVFVEKAKKLGKHVELYVEKGAGHGHQRIDHLQNQYLKVVEFFYRRIRQNVS